jgi:pyruvate/2-oxoacid:ferredoxin oxidoreductase beta subunit
VVPDHRRLFVVRGTVEDNGQLQLIDRITLKVKLASEQTVSENVGNQDEFSRLVASSKNRVFDIRSENLPTWCPGCGYFGIHQGLNNAIQEMGLPHHRIVTVSGIGCAGRYPFFTNTYGLHTVHGRTLPVATGVKLASPELTVFAVGGRYCLV